MSQRDKTIKKMKNNPKGWRIDDCKSLADHFDIAWVQDGSSHCVFDFGEVSLSIPAKRPIKPFYIKKFVVLIEEAKA
ncbi:MAG: hypothetical protein HOI59_10610 [Nitrospina sp.]|nr:hypothetical protein [Nitrospina sp.]MBT5261977.1 hypothetical protein [Nitrospina sp.]MBT5764302.1 hypothetical protein [Nitrospina sp.]MBT5958428.1 hypothetical protein [Nitrospina sp.]MBT6408102.1 hypothetical protein [Nitrospina sp.]